MQIDSAKIKEILLRENYLDQKDLERAEVESKRNHSDLLDFLLNDGLVTPDLIGQAMAEEYGVPYADLNSNQPKKEQVLLLPEKVAKKYKAVIFKQDKRSITVTSSEPNNKQLVAAVKQIFPKKKVTIAYSLQDDINVTFVNYQKPLKQRFEKILQESSHIAVDLIDEIFKDALVYHTSDIHFEPREKDVTLRFRIDGVLKQTAIFSHEIYRNILNRIKVQSRLRIDEHFAAQDGSMRHQFETKTIDFRTSIIPTVDGEKIVLCVLASYVKGSSLSDLGLSVANQEMFENAAAKPFGMILVTGPTGSGKTTSLYALLKMLNNENVNITTIEDPVEYKIDGLNQIQVNKQTDLTFAKGLRSVVRQDPDIILVGEIRDEETAEIAVNAALTGHLLLSTFHANDAATSIPRLLDMNIEPFLLASTLELIVAQRLVRKICDSCRISHTITKKELLKTHPVLSEYVKGKTITMYKGKGCSVCGHTGYKGRTAIFEFIHVTPEMTELILSNPSTQQVNELAKQQGTKTLFEDGLAKVLDGKTTVQELLRIAPVKIAKKKSKKTTKK